MLITTTYHVIWVAIKNLKASPGIIELSQFKMFLLEEMLVRVDDPFDYIFNLLLESKEGQVREKNYQIIKPLVDDQTGNAHLYLGKFGPFFKIVNIQVVKHQLGKKSLDCLTELFSTQKGESAHTGIRYQAF